MKTTFAVLLIASILPIHSSFAQTPAGGFGQRLAQATASQAAAEAEQSLTKFDLDFPGGKPGQLVVAIEKATGKPLNAIVPDEFASTQLPALKMKSVTVPRLFEALAAASVKKEVQLSGNFGGFGGGRGGQPYQVNQSSYGFRAVNPEKEDAVWYFYREMPVPPPAPLSALESPKKCRFWNLAPYLETYTIEDIMTAIQTSSKMLHAVSTRGIAGVPGAAGGQNSQEPGESPGIGMKFHKDTKLLIAVGEDDKLQLIDALLEQLAIESRRNATAAEIKTKKALMDFGKSVETNKP